MSISTCSAPMQRHQCRKSKAVDLYRKAKHNVQAAGFAWEIDWQRERCLKPFSERDLLRESAWVILCSGFREATVRKVFDYISLCFCDWESSEEIARHRSVCVATASARFRNGRKIDAIARVADLVKETGFDHARRLIKSEPIKQLQKLPFIGPVTSWHLAKNLGLDVAKNDRHLARMAAGLGYADAHDLCGDVSEATGELVSVIDVVLWRFATLVPKVAGS
jgi:hypothetical protein